MIKPTQALEAHADDGALLLAAIRAHPLELTAQLAYRDWADEHPERVRAMIAAAAAELPDLTAFGVGMYHDRTRTVTATCPPERWRERFDHERAALLGCQSGFAAAMAWLATRGRRATADAARDSYGYKHDVERAWEATPHPVYVANGELIAAAVASGVVWKRVPFSPNVTLGVSRRPPRPR